MYRIKTNERSDDKNTSHIMINNTHKIYQKNLWVAHRLSDDIRYKTPEIIPNLKRILHEKV